MWQRFVRFLSHHYLPILSGLLIGTSYIPFPPWAIYFCFIPLWISWIKRPQFKSIVIGSWLTGFFLTLIGFHWIAHTAHEFGQLPWVAAIPVLILFCIFNNIFVVGAGILWWLIQKYIKPPQWILLFSLPLVTITAETYFAGIFPWNFGYSWLYMDWPGFQIAEYTGFYGLSFAGMLINWMLLMAWLQRQQRYRLFIYFFSALVFVTGINIIGYTVGQHTEPGNRELSVLQVQANIGNLDKIRGVHGGRAQDVTVSRFIRLTESALDEQSADLIVWPETAFPTFLDEIHNYRTQVHKLKAAIRRWQTPLFTGAYSWPSRDSKVFNSAFLLDENANTLSKQYNKTYLLAFGEYMPGDELFPFVRKAIPTISDFGRGSGPQTMEFKDLTLGPQICYESLYPEFSRQLALMGSDFIVNITNDSWFGRHAEPYQHLYMTLARAIEVRRPLVRNTNTGITTAITRDGQVLEQSPIHEQWSHHFKVPVMTDAPQTFFTRVGYRFPLYVAILALALNLIGGLLVRVRNA